MTTLCQRAKRRVVASILRGRYAIGDVLPPVEQLAPRLGHSPATVRKALLELADEQVVRRIRRKGTVVIDRPRLGRVCLLLSRDAHLNGLLAEPVFTALHRAGFDVSMTPYTDGSPVWIEQCERLRRHRQPARFLVSLQAMLPGDPALDLFQRVVQDFPHRVLWSQSNAVTDPAARIVSLDHRREARDVVAHLLALGHRVVAVPLHEEPGHWERTLALGTARLLDAGGGRCVTLPGPRVDPACLDALVKNQGVTAFWAMFDHQALLVMNQAQRRGLRVPEDFSIVGRNDTPWSVQAPSPLTTVSLNPPGIARAIVRAVRAQASGDTTGALTLVRPKLVVRRSTAPANRPASPPENQESSREEST